MAIRNEREDRGISPSGDGLFDLVVVLWRMKVLVLAVPTVFTTAAIAYSFLATPLYRSDVVVVHRETNSLSPSLSQLGGLASLAGLDVGGSADSIAPLAVLRSREFAQEFIETRGIADTLLADAEDPGEEQDIRDAVSLFDERVRTITEDTRSGLVVLSITWKDPNLSAAWANDMIALVNARLRERALREAEQNVLFLKGQLAETSVPALQQSIGDVLRREMQKLVLARSGEEFAFRVVDRAVPPKHRISPRRKMLVLLAGVAGMALGVAAALIVNAIGVYRRRGPRHPR